LAVDAKCKKQRFFKCADEFNKALHLKTPKDPNELDREIKELEKKGEKRELCQATKHFESCLGQELKECISVDFLKSLGLSDKDARGYVHIFYQELEGQCKHQISFAVNAKCESQLFSTCTDTFAKALGLPNMPTDASVLDNQIKQLESQGKQRQVCEAAGKLQICLGQEYDDCLSVEFLKSIGESDKDAKKFVELSQQLEKQCAQVGLAVNDKCDPQRFTTCSDKFAKDLGLPGSMPADSRIALLQILTVEASGRQGAQQVCQAEANLQRCLGSQYDDCLSVAFFKSIGESDADAQAYTKLSDLLKKSCVH